MKKFFAFFFSALFIIAPGAWSRSGVGGRAAFEFLKVSPVARAVAMGEAYSAVGDDVGAIFYNPAGLAGVLTNEFHAAYLAYVENVNYEFIAFAYPLGPQLPSIGGTLAASVNLLQLGSSDRVDDQGVLQGTFTSGNSMFTFAYSRQFAKTVHGGLSTKVIRQQIDTLAQSAVAFDAGVVILPPFEGLRVAVVARNLGGQVESFDLPFSLSTSASYRRYELFGANDDAAIAVEGLIPIRPIEDRLGMRVGLEYNYKLVGHRATIRAGYRFLDTDVDGIGLTVGGGYGVDFGGTVLFLDYAFMPAGPDFGSTHRISLTTKF